MANTPETIAQQNTAIKQALEETNALAERYSKISSRHADTSIQEPGEIGEVHTALSLQTAKLLRTVRGPVDMIFSHFENSATTGAARALLEMGVFEALPPDGKSRTATDLSESLGVDRVLLVRLMRMATITGLFQEVGSEEYAHTPYSMVYLVPELRGVFKLMIDEYLPAKTRLHEFFRVNGWENPISERNNPYTFAHQTNNQTMWEFLGERPDRAKVFNYAMAAQSEATNWTVGIFPFGAELSKYDTDENTPLVVDVGGGKGHVIRQIKELCPNVKGSMILQDRGDVIADITEPLPDVKRMEHDFFTPQPVKGALIYYIRRCLHDWSDELCIKILSLLADAMTPGKSRLLIAEIVLPAIGADLEAGWMDLTMMTLTGMERTEKQWAFLLDASGFKLDKVHTAPGTNYGVVEASLK